MTLSSAAKSWDVGTETSSSLAVWVCRCAHESSGRDTECVTESVQETVPEQYVCMCVCVLGSSEGEPCT